MFKKVFIATLIVASVAFNGFAKQKPFESEEAAVKAAKSEAQKEVNELLESIQKKLKSNKGNVNYHKTGNSAQFLCQESKIVALYKNGKVGNGAGQLKETVGKLNDKKIRPSDFTFTNIRIGKAEVEDAGKNEFLYTIPVSFDAVTTTPAIENNAKYVVTFYFEGKFKKDSKGYTTSKKVEFKSSTVTATDLFDSESAYMKQKAADRIAEWYTGLPANLDNKYARYSKNNKGIRTVDGRNIAIKQNGRTFTATGKPIEIDFVPEIDESYLYLYTDPTATIAITPSFSITFGDDLKTIVSENIVNGYTDGIKEAVTDPEKTSRYESARIAVGNFSNALSGYVAENNKVNRENVTAMFADSKNDEVAVSHRSAFNNKESINLRKADNYLQLLRGNNLNFKSTEYIDSNKTARLNAEYPELGLSYDPNLYTVMFDVIQQYEGNNYSDKTRKIVVMKKNDNGSYLIERIIVVPNSTTIVE